MRIRRVLPAAVLALALALGACGGDDDNGGGTLTVVTHDSFNLSEELIQQFEEDNEVTVQLLPKGDAGSMLTSLILTKGNPEGDVAFGVDNTFLSRALDEGVFEEYEPEALANVPDDLRPGNAFVTPIDYGYVNFNYDIAWFEENSIQPPETLEDLLKPELRGRVVISNPASSSPGLAFLIATVDYFGEDAYLDWWRGMRENGLAVVDGWETAYYTNFTRAGGEQPIVLSYATSPAFEQMFADPPSDEAPTANILPPKGVFRQVEYAGILAGTKNREMAERFIDFLLSVEVQEDIPEQMAVYPVSSEASVPEAFERFSGVTVPAAGISPDDIAANRQRWLDDWTQAVLR